MTSRLSPLSNKKKPPSILNVKDKKGEEGGRNEDLHALHVLVPEARQIEDGLEGFSNLRLLLQRGNVHRQLKHNSLLDQNNMLRKIKKREGEGPNLLVHFGDQVGFGLAHRDGRHVPLKELLAKAQRAEDKVAQVIEQLVVVLGHQIFPIKVGICQAARDEKTVSYRD